MTEPFFILALAIVTTTIGALPFGLVNLTVLDVSYHNSRVAAMRIAHGAAWIEVLFGMAALLAGSILSKATSGYNIAQHLAIIIPIAVGIIFFIRKPKTQSNLNSIRNTFFTGVLLNIISIQVLIYWIVAIAFIKTQWLMEINWISVLLFIVGIFLTKMGVLWLYARFSKAVLSRSDYLANNINRVIGLILIITGIIQFLK